MLSTGDKDGVGSWLKRKREWMTGVMMIMAMAFVHFQSLAYFIKSLRASVAPYLSFVSLFHHLSHLPKVPLGLPVAWFTSSLPGRLVSEGDPHCRQYQIVMYLYTFSLTSRGDQRKIKSSGLLEWDSRCIHIRKALLRVGGKQNPHRAPKTHFSHGNNGYNGNIWCE